MGKKTTKTEQVTLHCVYPWIHHEGCDCYGHQIRKEEKAKERRRIKAIKEIESCKTAEKKLKSCPFCGGKARLLPQTNGYSVDCLECGANVWEVTRFKKQITVKWNRRT